MRSWVDRILPSCCSRRNRDQTPTILESKSLPESFVTYDLIKENDQSQAEIEKNDKERNEFKKEPIRKAKSKPIDEILISPIERSSISSPETEVQMIPCYGRDNFITLGQGETPKESTINTSISVEKAKAILDQFTCSVCNKEAKGLCTGCVSKRFCINCYHSFHKKSSLKGHNLFLYSSKRLKRNKEENHVSNN
ncbi:unnamed protein product [Blepharisma stoltei]|uniref:Uncharacterized protein n=1 Tax=Blepharisma stoltei TaxID=1481888 RepID=A0AAU9IZT1_9CILI|nr:unnamed protein product [Blepharisma stoltei]